MLGRPPAQAQLQEEQRAEVDDRRERSADQLTFLQAEKELKAAAAELERQQLVVPSAVIGARANAQRLREENERAQREAMRAQAAERLLFIEAEKELKAKAAEKEREEMLREYTLATQQRKALEQACRPGTPPRSVLAVGSPRPRQGKSTPRRADPSSPSIFDRLAAEQKRDAHRKRQDLLDAREAAEMRDKPHLSPASRRLLRRTPSEGDAMARLSSPLRTGPKYESPRRSDELETPKFDSFKAKPMPDYNKIHTTNQFIMSPEGERVTQDPCSPAVHVELTGASVRSQPGEMDHLRRQLAAVRNRGLDESTQDLVEGLLATIDAKIGGNAQNDPQPPRRRRSPPAQSPRRSRRKRVNGKKKQTTRSDQRSYRRARASSHEREALGTRNDQYDGNSCELNAGTEGAHVAALDEGPSVEAEPLTPRAAYASLSAEKAAASGRVSPSAPFPPMEMSEETAKIICHAAKFVAMHGPQFFATLKSKHRDDPPTSPWGWISEPDSSDAKFFFVQRLEYEQDMISQSNMMEAITEALNDEPAVGVAETPSSKPVEPLQAALAPDSQLQAGADLVESETKTKPAQLSQSGLASSHEDQSDIDQQPAASNADGLRPSIFMPVNPEVAPWICSLYTIPVHTSCGLPWVLIGHIEKGQPVRLLEVGFDDNGRQRIRIGQDCWCSAEHSDGSPSFESCNGPEDVTPAPLLEESVPALPRDQSFSGSGASAEAHISNSSRDNDSSNQFSNTVNQAEENARNHLIAIGEEQSVSKSLQRDAFEAWTRDYDEGIHLGEGSRGDRLTSSRQPSPRSRQVPTALTSRKVHKKQGTSRSSTGKGRRSKLLRNPAATKASAGRKQAMADRSRAAQEQEERDRRVLERRRKKTDELAKSGDARRLAAIDAAKKVGAAQTKRAQDQKRRGVQVTQQKPQLATAQQNDTKRKIPHILDHAEDDGGKTQANGVLGSVQNDDDEKRREEEEAKLSEEDRAALARAREEELQRQLSEAEAARILGEELTRRREWLQQVPMFENIVAEVESIAFLNAVAEKLEVQTTTRHEFIVKKGEIGAEMYFIVRGEADVLSAPDEPAFATLTEGMFFGEQALLEDEPRNACVRAKGSLKMYVLTKQDLEVVFKLYPAMKLAITHATEARRLEREQAEADLVKFLNQNHDVTTEEDLVGRDTDRSENGEAEARAGSLEASEKASEDELVENVAGSSSATTTTVVVTRPIDVESGAEVEVETGDGQVFRIAIPEGVAPGEEFELEFENTVAFPQPTKRRDDDNHVQNADQEKHSQGELKHGEPVIRLAGDKDEQVDAFDHELADLLESSEDFDSEDTGLQEAEDVDADERRESPRAARQREADALQRRLASLELDAGLPSTDLPDSGETEQKGQDCGIAPDTSVEITLDEQDPFSALAALLTE